MSESLEGVDLYELLEISPRASQTVIRAAYRALARHYHPDVNKIGDAELRIRRINAAYRVLGDPENRARYDLELMRSRRAQRLRRTDTMLTASPSGRPQSNWTYEPRRASKRAEPALQMRRPEPVMTRVSELAVGVFLVVTAGALLFLVLWTTLDLSGDAAQDYVTPPEFSQR